MALKALSFLAADPERFERFIALSGLDQQAIRKAAREPPSSAAFSIISWPTNRCYWSSPRKMKPRRSVS